MFKNWSVKETSDVLNFQQYMNLKNIHLINSDPM